jgi:hypothetical protein
VVNSDESRLGRIKDLLVEHPKMIIFYNFDYELELLRTLDVAMAEWNGHKHQNIPNENEWVYLVQYAAGSDAWDCIETDTVVFYSLNYSYRVFEQCQGRIDRLNTPYTVLRYFVIRSSCVLDTAIYRTILDKKDFNERRSLQEIG